MLSAMQAGLLPSLVLVSNPAIQYMLYEQLQRLLRAWRGAACAGTEGQNRCSNERCDSQQCDGLQQGVRDHHHYQQQQQQHYQGQQLTTGQHSAQLPCGASKQAQQQEHDAEMQRLQEAWQQLQTLHLQQQQQQQGQQQGLGVAEVPGAKQGSVHGPASMQGSAQCHDYQEAGGRAQVEAASGGVQGPGCSGAAAPAAGGKCHGRVGGRSGAQLHPLEVFASSALAKVSVCVCVCARPRARV